MATLFADDFNRADGAPANGWTVDTGTWDISTNQLRGHVAGSRIHRSAPVGGTVDSVVELITGPGFSYTAGASFTLYIRSDLARQNLYYVQLVTGAVGTAALTIGKAVGGTGIQLAVYNQFAFSGGTHTLRFQCLGTLITVELDGVALGAVSDGDIASGDYIHMYTVPADKFWWDSFSVFDAAEASITMAPTQIRPGSTANQLSVYGQGSTWQPGIPGSPVFTVDVGSITYQEVLTGTSVVLTYDAPAVPGLATFTDPDNGQHALVAVTNSPIPSWLPASEPTGLLRALIDFSQALHVLIDPVGAAVYDALELGVSESVIGYLRGMGTPAEGHTLVADLAAVLDELQVDHDDPTTVRSVLVDILAELFTIDGYPSRVTLADLSEAIAGLSAPDLSAITEALSGIVDQLTAAQTSLNLISNNDTNNLGTVLADTGELISDVGTVNVNLDDTKANVQAIRTNNDLTLQSILTPLAGLGIIEVLTLAVGIVGLIRGGTVTALQVVNVIESVVADGADVGLVVADLLGFLGNNLIPTTTTITADLSGVLAAVNGVHDDLASDVSALSDALDGVETDLASDIAALSAKLDALSDKIDALQLGGPVWPGLAKVTLGDAVAVDGSTRITAPMDGCILSLSTIPPRNVYWTVSGLTNVERAGFLAFISDNGDADARQPIAWNGGVYLPKGLLTAAGVVLHLPMGVVGSLTPWVRTIPEL